MPAAWTAIPTPTHVTVNQLGARLSAATATITVFTDGSGGKNSSDPRLRRCGWAWVIPGPQGPICGVSGNLTGEQTVPRAELKALIEFVLELEQVPHITNVTIYSDCKMVVDLFAAGIDRCKQSKLWEMWRDFWGPYQRLLPRMQSFRILKVKSHSDTMPADLKFGNDMADKYAGEAVREITSGDEARVLRLDRKTRLFQERMIQAIMLLPKCARHPEEPAAEPTNGAPRLRAARLLQHEVHRRGPYIECARCGQFWMSKRIDILENLGPCLGHTIYGKPERDRPWIIPTGHKPIRWGQQELHRSHNTKWIRGVMYCTNCGAYSTSGPIFKKLASVCKPNPTSVYAQQTRGLSHGKLRPGLKQWPRIHNYPGNKKIQECHYYPDPEWDQRSRDLEDPRGLTITGRKAADKVRDLRLRAQLTGTTRRPAAPETPQPRTQTTWKPPEWIVQSLQQSGDMYLLEEPPSGQESRGSNEPYQASPPATNVETKLPEEVDSPNATALGEQTPGTPETPDGAYTAPSGLLFSGLYHGHVTVGNNGMYFGIGTTDGGQQYVDIGTDPSVDSSWFDEMLKPLDPASIPQHYPIQGSTWGLVR